MERKPYYVLRMKNSNLALHEGSARKYYHGGNAIQLYLTDEETLKKQLYLQELSKYNLSLWEDNND